MRNILNKYPFSSAKSISVHLSIPYSTTKFILNKIGFKKINLKYVPHDLTPNQKKDRKFYSKEILLLLKKNQKQNYNNIVTGDESWFFFYNPQKSIWSDKKTENPKIISKKNYQKKILLTIFFSPSGFHVIDELPEKTKFNSSYFCDNIITPLEKYFINRRPKTGTKNIFIHFDNAKPHISQYTKNFIFSKKFNLIKHPPYSPDISPYDFWLFGFIKEKLKGNTFGTREELMDKIKEILSEIKKEVILKVYEEWKMRLKEVIRTDGEYYIK